LKLTGTRSNRLQSAAIDQMLARADLRGPGALFIGLSIQRIGHGATGLFGSLLTAGMADGSKA